MDTKKIDLSQLNIPTKKEVIPPNLTPDPTPMKAEVELDTTQVVKVAAKPKPKVEEKKYQHYKSSKRSVSLFTRKTRKRITFINYTFVTDDEDCIEFLDMNIKAGACKGISKGAFMTVEEADPMAKYKAQIIAEYEAKKLAEAIMIAKGETLDMGSTEKSHINPGGSNIVPAAGSASGVS